MSTIKVNQIEPYSGGVVTITGFTAETASYAMSASFAGNALTSDSTLYIDPTFISSSAANAGFGVTSSYADSAAYVDGAILNYPDADGTTPTINRMISMTSASYAALDPKDANTFYVII
jgi:hypothetical protein